MIRNALQEESPHDQEWWMWNELVNDVSPDEEEFRRRRPTLLQWEA